METRLLYALTVELWQADTKKKHLHRKAAVIFRRQDFSTKCPQKLPSQDIKSDGSQSCGCMKVFRDILAIVTFVVLDFKPLKLSIIPRIG